MYYDYITYKKNDNDNNGICTKGICINFNDIYIKKYNLYVQIPYVSKRKKNMIEKRNIFIKISNLKENKDIYSSYLIYYDNLIDKNIVNPIFYNNKFYINNKNFTNFIEESIYQNIKLLNNKLIKNKLNIHNFNPILINQSIN